MPVWKSKAASKAKPTRKAKPDELVPEPWRQHSVKVIVDTGVERLSQKKKEQLVCQDRVERLFAGKNYPARANLEEAADAVLLRQMFQPKSKEEIAYLDKEERLYRDMDHLALVQPDEATEIIMFALLRLPQESLLRIREGVRRCLKGLDRESAERGPGRPKVQEKPKVLLRHVEVAFLKHVRKLKWPQIVKHFGMAVGKPDKMLEQEKVNIGTLTRQRNAYAELVYESLLDCGAGSKGENLNHVLSEMDFHTKYMLEQMCGLPVRKDPATCTKLTNELFLLAVRKGYGKPSPKRIVPEDSFLDRRSRFYEPSLL